MALPERPDDEAYDIPQQLYDCPPTLTDSDVIGFCQEGYLLLSGVVPDEINRRTVTFMDSHTYFEPVSILKEDWFVENVILNPEAAGAVRSLLGRDFGLPILMSQHPAKCPSGSGHWHRDGGAISDEEVHYLQVFYYPQDTPAEMGPTEVVPGSHRWDWPAQAMGHFAGIRNTAFTTAPAGSIFLTDYAIWHRKGRATAEGMRHLLKYNYWRTTKPRRDWIVNPEFDPGTADYGRNSTSTAEMYFWLSGRAAEFQSLGAQSWPSAGFRGPEYRPYGYPGQGGVS